MQRRDQSIRRYGVSDLASQSPSEGGRLSNKSAFPFNERLGSIARESDGVSVLSLEVLLSVCSSIGLVLNERFLLGFLNWPPEAGVTLWSHAWSGHVMDHDFEGLFLTKVMVGNF